MGRSPSRPWAELLQRTPSVDVGHGRIDRCEKASLGGLSADRPQQAHAESGKPDLSCEHDGKFHREVLEGRMSGAAVVRHHLPLGP